VLREQGGEPPLCGKARGIIMSARKAHIDLKKDKNEIFFNSPLDDGRAGPILFGIQGCVAKKKRGAGS